MRALKTLVSVAVVLAVGCEGERPVSTSTSTHASAALEMVTGDLHRSTADLEGSAREALSQRARELHLDGFGLTLKVSTTRTGLAGTYLRFAQLQELNGVALPVFGGEVIVLVRDEGATRLVRAINPAHFPGAELVHDEGDLGAAVALERALAVVGATAPQLSGEASRTRGVHVDVSTGLPRLAWRVHLPMDEATPPHDWTVFIDAATGAELERQDSVRFQAPMTGQGFVYDMNPVASTGNTALIDGNNMTTPALDAARFLVMLQRLDGSGFTRGAFADTRTNNVNNRVLSMTNDFQFDRSNLGFEQTNVYFHLDRAQLRIQALGFMNVNNRVQAAVVDAQNADNSFYSGNNLRLNFGVGGVDDAEDADIVLHEYGHSIQDNQVPGFGGGDEGAMGEGFGDYLAASFALTLAGAPQMTDPACVGEWDSTAYSMTMPKCLRRVDGTKHYPEAEANEVHDDGEMWSAALWKLRARLGADATDKLVLEAHFLLSTRATFFGASDALVMVDQMLNMGVNVNFIRRTMIAQGLSRFLTTPQMNGPVTSFPVSIGPVRDATGNYRNATDEVKTVTIPGATGLIVHFTRVDLEVNNQCLQQGCDNLYLTNGDGDLFQVVSGAGRTNITSNAVVGDTVNIRLVSDPSQVRFGYHVDRIDALGMVDVDAGVQFDGGVDPIDAGTPAVDAGRSDAGVRDSGVFFDAGMADAGDPPAGDGGAPPPPPIDSGVPLVDAGTPGDGGATSTVRLVKLGTEALTPGLSRGCGCGATPGAEWLGLIVVALARRRRAR